MNLHPLLDCAQKAEGLIQRGGDVYQQFTCAQCGAKQTMNVKNTFFTSGTCEECGGLTDIQKDGCNYMVHFAMPKEDSNG